MKSYTDLEQSKKLAKILPLSSADMCYFNSDTDKIIVRKWEDEIHDEDDTPCWSLAALYNVLPTIDDQFEPQLHRSLDKYRCTYEGEEDSSGLWRVANNPVDACVEMIEKLHELNLL